MPNLKYLNLKGNPICKHPTYRPLIISILPNLISLDEKVICLI